MARPITWQDVTGPNVGASLNASQAAGDSIRNALGGLANTALGYEDATKRDATGKAVAAVLSSDDPLAAAAAQPQGWQVDPLAVAQAAQTADARQRSNLASDASLDASKVSTELNRATLQDKTDERIATTLSSPLIDQIVKSGKLPSIDLNSDEWKTQAGNKAYKQVLDFYGQYQDDKLKAEDMHLRRQTALKDKAKEDAFGWARSFGGSAEGQGLDPAEVDRRITKEFQKRGVSEAYVGQGSQFYEQGAQANRATDTELDGEVPNISQSKDLDGNNRPSATYLDVKANLAGRISDINSQKAFETEKYQGAVQGRDLQAGNVFTGPVEGIPAKLATAKGWSEEDSQEAISAIRAEYKGLDAAQAADIALAHGGKWFEGIAARSDEAKAMAGRYQAFNDAGRTEGLQRTLDSLGSKYDKAVARVQVLDRQTTAAARNGEAIPTEAANIVSAYRQNADTKEKAARAEKKAADEAAAAAAVQAEKNRKAADDALQRAFERK